MKRYAILMFAMLAPLALQAQEVVAKVENVTIKGLDGEPAVIPHWGEKNLMLFYIDPDRPNQNMDFYDYLEDSKRAESDNVVGIGLMNLKDAPFIPNALARAMAAKRSAKSGATVLSDEGRIISEQWGLGDCNNYSVTILLNRAGEIVFLRKGRFTKEDETQFFNVLETLK